MVSLRATACLGVCLVFATGCSVTTTQTKNSRIKLERERELASRSAVVVTRANPDVRVERVDLVRSNGSAIAVKVRNLTDRPLSDLPISVGVAGRPLNARRGLPYFDTHLPAIAAGRSEVWVLPIRGDVPAGQPYAMVGRPSTPSATGADSLPAVDASASATRDRFTVRVTNPSDVPQRALQVYAWADSAGRIVAAGRASLDALDAGQSARLRIRLAGRDGVRPSISAPPTVFE